MFLKTSENFNVKKVSVSVNVIKLELERHRLLISGVLEQEKTLQH